MVFQVLDHTKFVIKNLKLWKTFTRLGGFFQCGTVTRLCCISDTRRLQFGALDIKKKTGTYQVYKLGGLNYSCRYLGCLNQTVGLGVNFTIETMCITTDLMFWQVAKFVMTVSMTYFFKDVHTLVTKGIAFAL